MRVLLLTSLLFIFFITSSFSGSKVYSPGPYILQPCAMYRTLSPSITDLSPFLTSNNKSFNNWSEKALVEWTGSLPMGPYEYVNIIEINDNYLIGYDYFGRRLILKNNNCFCKAKDKGALASVKEDIVRFDGLKISNGSYVWIVDQNLANSTVSIQITETDQVEVSDDKVQLFQKQDMERYMEYYPLKKVE